MFLQNTSRTDLIDILKYDTVRMYIQYPFENPMWYTIQKVEGFRVYFNHGNKTLSISYNNSLILGFIILPREEKW